MSTLIYPGEKARGQSKAPYKWTWKTRAGQNFSIRHVLDGKVSLWISARAADLTYFEFCRVSVYQRNRFISYRPLILFSLSNKRLSEAKQIDFQSEGMDSLANNLHKTLKAHVLVTRKFHEQFKRKINRPQILPMTLLWCPCNKDHLSHQGYLIK